VAKGLIRETAPTVVFGSLESEYLAIRVIRRMYDTSDYDDGNWLQAEIALRTRGFAGAYPSSLRAEEFERLRDGLAPMYHSLRGSARLHSLEGWLHIDIEGDGLGHLSMTYRAVSQHAPKVALDSYLDLDQTMLPAILDELSAVIAAFPVVGRGPARTG
jgi:hypothetical protein